MMTKYCIGVDIGGTKTSIGVVDTNKGKVIINKIIKSKYKHEKKISNETNCL